MGETFNPIGKTQNYENGIFSKIPIPRDGFAYVLTGSSNGSMPLVIQKQDIPRKEQIRQGKYCWITQIDIRSYDVSFQADLLAKDKIFYFCLEMKMKACVEFPDNVYLNNITDVEAAVKSKFLSEFQSKSIQYNIDDIQQLQDDISSGLKDVISLDSGIQLTDIQVVLSQDQAYTEHQKKLWREKQEKEKKIRELHDKLEYETERTEAANKLSKMYSSDITQVFAELANGSISPEEASKRIEARQKNQVAENFDERMRQMKEILELVKTMQDSGIGSPDTLAQKADQLLGILLAPQAAALNAGNPPVQALNNSSSEQVANIYAPPLDD